jgi:hypothetical protein
MGFQTPLYELSEYLKWTTSGKIQLLDFQRGCKWEDERIRSLSVTVLRGHPLGVVMLLRLGNDQIWFEPCPIENMTCRRIHHPRLYSRMTAVVDLPERKISGSVCSLPGRSLVQSAPFRIMWPEQ